MTAEARLEYVVTYAPALRASGVPIAPNLSRHQRAERKTETVDAPDADAAITLFERTTDRMVTACERAQ
jgi:hypothetical protein